MNGRDVRLRALEERDFVAMKARLLALSEEERAEELFRLPAATSARFYDSLSDAEVEALIAEWPPEKRDALEAMTDAQLEEVAAGRWPSDVPRPEEASP